MTLLIAGLALFFISHSISIINEPWRNRMAAQLGETVWQGLYGLVALAGLVFIVWGYGLAQQTPVPLYTPPPWGRSANLLLMLPVFPLLVATYFPGRIGAAVKHPMLLATLLWALAHLLVTGTLTSLLLFGCFLIWAIATGSPCGSGCSARSWEHRPPPGMISSLYWLVWHSTSASFSGCTAGYSA